MKNQPNKSIELPKMKHVHYGYGATCIVCGERFFRTYPSKYWDKICPVCYELGAEKELDKKVNQLKNESSWKLRLNLIKICNPLVRYASKFIFEERKYNKTDDYYNFVRKKVLGQKISRLYL